MGRFWNRQGLEPKLCKQQYCDNGITNFISPPAVLYTDACTSRGISRFPKLIDVIS